MSWGQNDEKIWHCSTKQSQNVTKQECNEAKIFLSKRKHERSKTKISLNETKKRLN